MFSKIQNLRSTTHHGKAYLLERFQAVEVVDLADDPEFRAIDAEKLVEVFPQAMHLFHRKKVVVYFNLLVPFLEAFSESIRDSLKSFKTIPVSLAKNKTFIIFRDANGVPQILPIEERSETCKFFQQELTQTRFKISMSQLGRKPPQNNITKTGQQISLKRYRTSVKKVVLAKPDKYILEKNFPCSGELNLPNYPIQVSEEQREGEIVSDEALVDRIESSSTRGEQPRDQVVIDNYNSSLDDRYPASQNLFTHPHPTHESIVTSGSSYDGLQRHFPLLSQIDVATDRSNTFVSQRSNENFATSRRRDNATPPRHPDYETYYNRLSSYSQGWPHDGNPSALTLTNAGFFFTKQADLVRCYQCGIGLKDFSPDDDPLLEHVRHSSQCPYLERHVDAERLAMIKKSLQCRAYCLSHFNKFQYDDLYKALEKLAVQAKLQDTDAEYNRRTQLNDFNQNFNAASTSRYRHPQYQTLEARLATFVNWPQEACQTPLKLAEAGMFYTGVEDHVRCFACDGGLRRWDPEDDPWTEHCRWFPACPYCIEQRGPEFIALIQATLEQDDGATGGEGLVESRNQLTVHSPQIQALFDECRDLYRDMGFEEDDVKQSILELVNRGTQRPPVDEVVDQIQILHERREEEAKRIFVAAQIDSPVEQNILLKDMVYCKQCRHRIVNALFLPCTHLKFCMECAEPLNICPLCDRVIREKIKTYMG